MRVLLACDRLYINFQIHAQLVPWNAMAFQYGKKQSAIKEAGSTESHI